MAASQQQERQRLSSAAPEDPAAELARLKVRVRELEAVVEGREAAPTLELVQAASPVLECLEQAPDCVGIFTALRNEAGVIADFRIDYLNEAAVESNGMPREAQIGKNLCEILPRHRESGLFRQYCQVVESRAAQDFESLQYSDDRNGAELARALDIRAFPLKDGFAAIWRDVTARKQRESKLLLQRDLLRNILNSTEDAIFLKDNSGKYVLLNRAAAAYFGPAEQIKGYLELDEDSSPSWGANTPAAPGVNTAFHQGSITRCEELVVTPAGPRSLSTVQVPFKDPSGSVQGMVGIARDVTEQIAAEASLRESRERLRAALLGAGTGTFRWDIRTNALTWDENLERLFGLAPGQTASTLEAFLDLVHPDDRAAVKEQCRRCAEEGADFATEFRVIWRDGSVHWLADRGKTFFDDQGRAAYMTGACVDVTERRGFIEALRCSEERFRRLADAMPQIVWISNPDGRVVYFNSRWTEYTGLTQEQSLGLDCVAAHHPDDSARVLDDWARSIHSQEPFENEHRLRGRDGVYRWHLARSVPVRDENGAILHWFGTATNIHEHKEALRRLTSQQAQLALTHSEVGTGSFEYNFEQDINVWSPEMAELYGLEKTAVTGTLDLWRSRILPEDLPGAEAALLASTKSGSFVFDFRIRRPDGEIRWLHARGHVDHASDGRPLRMIGINLDVTDQKLAQAEVQRARDEAERANRAKDAFLAALSHELRTPLTPVLMTVQLLEQDGALPEHVREDLRNVRRNVEIETRLIDDLLDLTRITRGKLPLQVEEVNLHEVLHHAVETSRDDMFVAKRLDVRVEFEAENFGCMGDSARLGQIFWNLIKNAAKFTPHEGVITIRTLNPEPNEICVEVIDTGIGIPSGALPHIFNAFEQGGANVTQQFGGLGLGLAICRTLTELHGGRISAASAGPNRGASFRVTLPAGRLEHRTTVHRDLRQTSSADAPRNSRRILLVEDHEQTGRILMRLLRRFGYDVAWASTVAEAKQFASLKTFDLVVSDLGLPDGTGHELMSELRDRHGLKGLALSGYGMEEDMARSIDAGFVDHLVKPLNFEKLEGLLRGLLT